jgi:archaemetzincin
MGLAEKRREVYERVEDESGWIRLGPPRPGEWLYVFREEGQTPEEYKKEVGRERKPQGTTIYIQPIGEVDPGFRRILRTMEEYATIFFRCKATLNEPIPIPHTHFNRRRGQFNAEGILSLLKRRRPDDALAYIGVIEEDLYVEGMNFVFGLASFDEGVGVYSLARYGTEVRMRTKRALKVMVHEVCHILRMKHCVFYRCIVCGSNSLMESDRRPMHLCPVCLEKLEWRLGFDTKERYMELRDFYLRMGLEEEARFVTHRLSRY